MNNSKSRRENLLKFLYENQKPISGENLAKNFDVTRQVIVQDIAILRACLLYTSDAADDSTEV